MNRRDMEFQRRLRDFDAVWERVGRDRPGRPPRRPGPEGPFPPPPPPGPGPRPPLMPGRKPSRCRRRCPPGRR